MNRDRVLFRFGGARLALDRLIMEMREDREREGFSALMAHLPFVYYKLNQAWNERNLPDDVVDVEGGDRIPRDLPGILDLL